VRFGIGQSLREARSALGLDLEELEKRTKIRARYLSALEEERWDALPGSAYTRAFLRTYAQFLGLDGELLVEEYRRVHEPPEEEAAPEQLPSVGAKRTLRLPSLPEELRLPDLPREVRLPSLPRELPRPGPGMTVALAVVALLGIILVIGLVAGSDEEGGEVPAPAETAPEEEAATEEPTRVALTLETTGTVWVCLVDDEGVPVVQGETLFAPEERGPFRARAFEITLGNGQIRLTANDEPISIPAAAEPLGYRITPEATRELAPGERPTCA
jgi:cytoskeleton protein RodZ